MVEDKRTVWIRTHQKTTFAMAAAVGIVLPIVFFVLGTFVSIGNFSFPLGKNYPLSYIIILGIMLAVIAGDYLGRILLNNNQTVAFLLSFFTTSMVLIGIGESSIFFLVIVLMIAIGVLEFIDVIKLQDISGIFLKYIRKFFISILGGTVNIVSISPVLKIYIGSYSGISWLLVSVLIIFVWKEQIITYIFPNTKLLTKVKND
ncbi:MAG TPA: hypothetical protein VKU94_02630 [Geobacterales bacterium]|nr:hypothetical protein [Geobacterales bacterium]